MKPVNAQAGQRQIGHQRQALATVVIDHGQNPKPTADREST
ncbi:hypothetical protein LP7551_01427 [Roseibium album]|nr:hypothetical protein LP7551_01427 [Roseibium album]